MSYRKLIEDVTAFHKAFGHTVNLDHIPAPHKTQKEMNMQRAIWVCEEIEEARTAVLDNSIAAFADALADMRYFAAGTAVANGFDVNERAKKNALEILDDAAFDISVASKRRDASALAELRNALFRFEVVVQGVAAIFSIPLDNVHDLVQAANMAKLGTDGKPLRNPETGKVVKPEGWTPPDAAIAEVVAHLDFNIV